MPKRIPAKHRNYYRAVCGRHCIHAGADLDLVAYAAKGFLYARPPVDELCVTVWLNGTLVAVVSDDANGPGAYRLQRDWPGLLPPEMTGERPPPA